MPTEPVLTLGWDDGGVDPEQESGGSGAAAARADDADTPRLVEVAIDAAGAAGARPYTYAVPPRLADLEPGEAVLVEFGKRQALAVVLGPASVVPTGGAKSIVERVRADGPLLPPLTLALARWIAGHYLAPPALVIRAMLPPGLLERLELVAERTPRPAPPHALEPSPAFATTTPGVVTATTGVPTSGLGADPIDRADSELLDQLGAGPVVARELAAPDGRAGLLRRLRRLEALDLVTLDWTLSGAAAGPRYERWAMLTAAGAAAAAVAGRGRAPGRPLGPRQLGALAELAGMPGGGLPTAQLAVRHGTGAVVGLVRRGLVATDVRERPRRPLADRPPGLRGARPPASTLSAAQREAVERIEAALHARDATPLLLDGATGGGKTAVYTEAIIASLAAGRPALVLVPEIALALPIVDRLRSDLDVRVALVHSALGDGERADEWRRIRAGDVDIVVGTRLAVLAPLADVGVVIVDEEHDQAYKSDRTPRLQARDTALQLASIAGAAVVLGSATPAVETLGRARDGRFGRVELVERASGAPPRIEVVDLRGELAAGNRGLLSMALDSALHDLDVGGGEQAILVLNRRGSASIVLCRDCGHVQACPDCERPLVYHQAGTTLRCHHCGRATPLATRCPNCDSPRIRYLGGGTERVERDVRRAHPRLRVDRLDRDVAERKGAAARVIDAFAAGRTDVLVGTSIVAKGLDIPNVTLVGVVSSDVALNLPDERAAERTFQLLTQAVGRAGRGDRAGRGILQTYQPEHPAIQAVASGDARTFYASELELRRRFGSPPYGDVVKLTVALADRDDAERTAETFADVLRTRAAATGAHVTVAGPAPAFIARRNDRWRFHVVLRGDDPVGLLGGDPGPPWSVDVDPESLL